MASDIRSIWVVLIHLMDAVCVFVCVCTPGSWKFQFYYSLMQLRCIKISHSGWQKHSKVPPNTSVDAGPSRNMWERPICAPMPPEQNNQQPTKWLPGDRQLPVDITSRHYGNTSDMVKEKSPSNLLPRQENLFTQVYASSQSPGNMTGPASVIFKQVTFNCFQGNLQT